MDDIDDTNHPSVSVGRTIIFDKPVDGLELRSLNDCYDNCGGQHTANFVTGKVVGVMPAQGFYRESDSHRGGCRYVPYTKFWALVCRSEADQVTALSGTISKLQHEIRALQDARSKHEGEAKKTQKHLDTVLAERATAMTMRDRLDHAVTEASKRNQKLEADLAAVKRHIGEKAYADALAGKS